MTLVPVWQETMRQPLPHSPGCLHTNLCLYVMSRFGSCIALQHHNTRAEDVRYTVLTTANFCQTKSLRSCCQAVVALLTDST